MYVALSAPSFDSPELIGPDLAGMPTKQTPVSSSKVRGCAIDDRAPLRVAGPGWEEAFFSYLSKIECPYQFADATGRGDVSVPCGRRKRCRPSYAKDTQDVRGPMHPVTAQHPPLP